MKIDDIVKDNIIYGLIGLSAGIAVTLAIVSASSPDVERIKVFQRENKSAVIRLYKLGSDAIHVADSEKEGNYIPLGKYLNGIKDEADRKIEEETIKKVVDWYK